MVHSSFDPQVSRFGPQQAVIEPIQPVDFLGLLKSVWAGKWLIVLTMILTIGGAGYYAFRIAEPQFEATARIAYFTSPLAGIHPQEARSDDMDYATKQATLSSDVLLISVIDTLDLRSDPEFNRYLNTPSFYSITFMRQRIRNFLAGTKEAPPSEDQIHQKAIANLRSVLTIGRLADTGIFEITVKSGSAQKANQIADTIAAQYLIMTQSQRREAHQTTTNWLEEKVSALGLQLAHQEDQISTLIATAQIQSDAGLDTLSKQILSAEHGRAQAIAEIEMLSSQQAIPNTRTIATLAQKQEALGRINTDLDRLQTQLAGQSSGLAALHQIEVEAAATREVYATYLTRLQQMRAQSDLIGRADASMMPAGLARYVGPQKVLILTVAAALGLLIGLVLVAFRQMLQTGISDAADLRLATGLPVIAQLTKRQINNSKHVRASRSLNLTNAAKSLCTSLLLSHHGELPKTILSTSSALGEGKGVSALTLAGALVRTGKSVLFLAADQDDPVIHNYVRQFKDTALPNMDIHVTWEDHATVDILNPATVETILARDYDHIVIDAPPVTVTPETIMWAHYANTVIYSVSCAKTELHIIKRGLRALNDADAHVIGLILTQIKPRKRQRSQAGAFIAPAPGVRR